MLNSDQGEEGVIDLRKNLMDEGEPEFVIHRSHGNGLSSAPAAEVESAPSDKVKVKFDKFVNLVAANASEEILKKHAGQDIVIATDLLADLASVQEEVEESGSKWPLIFVVGVLLGVGVAWLIFK